MVGMPQLGAMVGAMAGSAIDRLIWPTPPIAAQRLDDLKVQTCAYGTPIPRMWGTVRLAGNVIWADEKQEVVETQGGGCFGGPEVENVQYTCTFAVQFCSGPIDKMVKLWANTKLLYDGYLAERSEETIRPRHGKIGHISGLRYRLYYGTEDQMPDPWIEAIEGVGNVPAYRGTCYMVIKDMPLRRYGNAIPNLTVELTTAGMEMSDYVPYETISSLVWGSDDLVWCPDGVHFVIHAAGYWYRVNTLTDEVVVEATHLRENGLPLLAHLSDFDIDERGIIHTTKYSATANRSYLAQIDSDTLVELGASTAELYCPARIRVSRKASFPYLVALETGGAHLHVTDRDTYSLRSGNTVEFDAPAGLAFYSCDIDEDNKTIWAVCKKWNDSEVTTNVVKIVLDTEGDSDVVTTYDVTASINYGQEIIFDSDTNQIIIGAPSDVDTNVAFFDADDMSPLAYGPASSIKTTGISPWPKSCWQQGPVAGYLYYPYGVAKIYRINIAERRIDGYWDIDPSPGSWHGGSIYDPVSQAVICGVTGDGFSWAKVLIDRVSPQHVHLSEIVDDVSEAVGLDPETEIDTTELTDEVIGFLVKDAGAARSAVQSLMDAFFFDTSESEGEIRFKKLGGAAVLSIPEADLGARPDGSSQQQKLVTTRAQEEQLPREVRVAFPDINFRHEKNVQRASRVNTRSLMIADLVLPVVMGPNQAKQIAQRSLALAWLRRNRHTCWLPRRYLTLDPADVVNVTEGGVLRKVRIERITSGPVLETQLAPEDDAVYLSSAEGAEADTEDQAIDYPGPTTLALLDLPLLRSGDNRPGTYVATAGVTDDWRGAAVFRSVDDGVAWNRWGMGSNDAVMGRAMNALPDVPDPNVWDEGNELILRLPDAMDVLSDATIDEVLAGANIGALGDEVIQWRNADLQADGSYILTGLLRGRKGSEWATADHTIGERFVVLDETTIAFRDLSLDELGLTRLYRAVSLGMEWNTGIDTEFSCLFRCLKPLSPVHIEGVDDAGDTVITWQRRTRFGGEWLPGVDAPLGETSENYEIDVYSDDAVVRTITAITSPTYTYTAEERVEDGFVPAEAIEIRVYQISSLVGRGFAGSAII